MIGIRKYKLSPKSGLLGACLAVSALAFGCTGKQQIFPTQPQIQYLRLEPNHVIEDYGGGGDSTIAYVVLHFQDGDGDLGSPADNKSYNFFLEDMRKDRLPETRLGQQIGIDSSGFPIYAIDTLYDGSIPSSLPDLTPDARNPSIQGEIRYQLAALHRLPNKLTGKVPPVDSVRFRIYIKDRAGNVSNIVETDPIFIYPK